MYMAFNNAQDVISYVIATPLLRCVDGVPVLPGISYHRSVTGAVRSAVGTVRFCATLIACQLVSMAQSQPY